jgi:hypothetical protein
MRNKDTILLENAYEETYNKGRNSKLEENVLSNNQTVTEDLPLNKPIKIKQSGHFIRIDDKTLLGINGKKYPFKKYLGKSLLSDPIESLSDFYLWVDFRLKKISEDELNSRLIHKERD